ncbi:hypothetical protein [Methanoculleus chikugoensis]|uniref:hypothetical protein n=1 Tax=Methanoculleus chikugoensis TaxID=118126 RepID=UPI0006D1C11B|nr:hypothetical protein [Methanoculleus chikugoensis]
MPSSESETVKTSPAPGLHGRERPGDRCAADHGRDEEKQKKEAAKTVCRETYHGFSFVDQVI